MKWLKWALMLLLAVLVINVVDFFYINTSLINEAERNPGFKQSERRLYRLFVDDDIKNAPRITDDYYFRFRRMDGPSAEISGIVFNGATETAALEKYLAALGYQHVSDDEFGQRWEKDNRPNPNIYIWRDTAGKTIFLTKYSL
ncbi:hypothetical protein COO59_16700 [Mixta theicola]|uniref:Uncharacterized protein n=2 Tax=Mixta theicola TaxID=1458355 RepID=A0A2K1Q680_9GAMM|nr:hypothetical protein COO59_16700 [Mixta theicola]GLR07394.1 hypothetical protein GCM10007905_01130 [Mixta theicola]